MISSKKLLKESVDNLKTVITLGGIIVGAVVATYHFSVKVSDLEEVVANYKQDMKTRDSIKDIIMDFCNPKISQFQFREDFQNYKEQTDKKIDALFYGKQPRGRWN